MKKVQRNNFEKKKILGILMVVLSSISMAAYKCIFHDGFKATPEAYFFHLFYYRSRHCDSSIDWSILGLEIHQDEAEALHMPDEISLVTRTYNLSLAQLILNSFLIVCSLGVLGKIIELC